VVLCEPSAPLVDRACFEGFQRLSHNDPCLPLRGGDGS
jgi:hypothetical protein